MCIVLYGEQSFHLFQCSVVHLVAQVVLLFQTAYFQVPFIPPGGFSSSSKSTRYHNNIGTDYRPRHLRSY